MRRQVVEISVGLTVFHGFPWGLQWQLENEMGHITSGQTGLFACCAVLCLVPCSIVTQIVCLPCTLLNFCFGARQGGS